MNPLLNCPTRTLETPAITTLAGNGFGKNISQENQLNNFGVTNLTQSEETILCSSGASTNILFSDRKNKNNSNNFAIYCLFYSRGKPRGNIVLSCIT